MRRAFTPLRLLVGATIALAGVFVVLWLVPSNSYLYLPDDAHPVEPFVHARGEKPSNDGGGIYLVDVLVRKATLLERLFPGIRDGSTLAPPSRVNPSGESDEKRMAEDRRLMHQSQQIAAAVALRELGYKVVMPPTGALIGEVAPGKPAAGRVQPGEVIVSVDRKPVRTLADLRRLMGRHRPGERVRLGVRNTRGVRTVVLRTVAADEDPSHPIVGVSVEQAATIRLPFPVRIDVGEIGGPSAGLAFALDLMEELGRDVDRGYRIAATGELAVDGTVGPVGALKQKTIGARRTKVDVFLVPVENAAEARRYADGLRVVPVKSFRQALQVLATLPPKT